MLLHLLNSKNFYSKLFIRMGIKKTPEIGIKKKEEKLNWSKIL